MRALNHRQRSDLTAQKCAILRHVCDASLEQVIEVSADHVTFEDVWNGKDGGVERLQRLLAGFLQGDLDEHQQIQTEGARVQQRTVAADKTGRFKFAQPLRTRRCRQVDPLGQVRNAGAAILL